MPRTKDYIYPVTIVYKTSKYSDAKTKLKSFNYHCVDEVLDETHHLPGVPDSAEILDIGVGESLINELQEKYKLQLSI